MPKTKKLSVEEIADAFMQIPIVQLAEALEKRGVSISAVVGHGGSKKKKRKKKKADPNLDEMFKVLPNDHDHVKALIAEARRLNELSVNFSIHANQTAAEFVSGNSWAFGLAGAWLRVHLSGELKKHSDAAGKIKT